MLPLAEIARYIPPLREGSSLPAPVEADDGREYVAKSSSLYRSTPA